VTTEIAPLEAEYPADPDAGLGALTTSHGNLPLDAVEVNAAIAGTSARVELTQEFRNPFDVPLEATYIVPLPDRAAVTAMRMECAGHVVEGLLKERGQAREDYDRAIAAGRRAGIAEQDRPDVFTMRAGNILPGERVTVRLELAQPLPYADGELTFRFPLVVAPRYIPGRPLPGAPAGSGVAADTDAVPDASRISPPVLLPGFPNPVRLTLSADIDPAGLPLAGIRSSLHGTAEQAGADGHTIVRLRPGERLDRDFILRLALAGQDQITTSLMLTPDPGADPAEGTFTLTVVPPAGAGRPRPRDVVLVLDRSGSMGGWKIVAARRAAARIVDTLTGTDRFAVLCFDTVVERPPDLPDGLAAGTDRNRFRAVEWLARTDARGGTEMLAPLEQAAGLLAEAGADRERVLVLVTDGQVGNEDQILERLGPRLGPTRVHVVGIDQAVNAGFLARLAAAGRGRCELVESEDRLDEAAARIHRRIGAPLVTGLALAADGVAIVPGTVAPRLLPDLFGGVAVTLAGRWQGQPAGTITVTGTAADGTPFESKVSAVTGGHRAATAVWARAHVRDLEDRYASQPGHDPTTLARLEQQITGTSLRYGVLCRFTAFVAVDTRVVTDGAAPHRVTQPVDLPAGWDPAGLGHPPAIGWHAASGAVAAAAAAPAQEMAAPMRPAPGRPAQVRSGRPATPMRARKGFISAAPGGPAPTPMTGPGAGAGSRMTGPGGPLMTAPGTGAGSRLDRARRQAGDEADALRAAAGGPDGERARLLADGERARLLADGERARLLADGERARLLADLATRIEALLAALRADPALAGQPGLDRLAELARDLHACDGPGAPGGARLDALWQEAIGVLTEFAADANPGPSRAFWKRSR
jgi:Ca-activated chloride channel family protein